MGMLNKVVPLADLMKEAKALAQKTAGKEQRYPEAGQIGH